MSAGRFRRKEGALLVRLGVGLVELCTTHLSACLCLSLRFHRAEYVGFLFLLLRFLFLFLSLLFMRSQCGAVAGSIGQRAAGQAAARRAADAAVVRGDEAGAIASVQLEKDSGFY